MLMQIVFAMMLMVTTVFMVVSIDRENPPSARIARQQVDNMRGFALAVDRFVSHNLDYKGVVTWSGYGGTPALREAKSTPHSLRGVVLPRDWYAVLMEEGEYVLCMQNVNAEGIALLGQNFPSSITPGVVPLQGRQAAVVFSHPNDFVRNSQGQAKAKQWINQCNF